MTRARLLILAATALVLWAIWSDVRDTAACEARGGRVVRWSGVPLRCVP